MTDEKIKELAQSCAEACLERYASMQDSEIAKGYSDVMETAIRTILKTHCIVEKSKLKEEYEHNSEMYDLGCVVPATMGHVHKGKMELLEYLFGKELFNGTEK